MKYPIVWEFPTQENKALDATMATRTRQKAIGKTRKLHVHHAFFFRLHFFAVTTRFRTFYGGRKQVTTKFFSLSELECGCQEFGSKRVRLHLTKNAS